MRFGICTSIANASLALQAGFDYVECGAGEMTMMNPWQPDVYSGLNVESMNLFFAHHLDIYTSEEWRPYGKTLVERAKEIGVQRLVVGSGGLRKSRPEIDVAQAEELFLQILRTIQDDNDVVLYPESLNRSETDVFNDCGNLAREAQKMGVGYTADSYHLLYEWDANGREGGLDAPSESFWHTQMPYIPGHVHMAALVGRLAPKRNDPMITGFVNRLSELGYDERIIFECRDLEPAGFAEALADFKSYF